MWCDIDPDKFSALQSNYDKDIEQVKANGWGNEQAHGGDVGCMVMQEGAPSSGGRPASLDHILRDAGLSDLKAELEQLAMDARRSPQRIVDAHPPDQRAQLRVDLRSASKGAQRELPQSMRALCIPCRIIDLCRSARTALPQRPLARLDQEQEPGLRGGAARGGGGLGPMKLANPPGAQFEILVDGKPRSYRDIKSVAIASAEFLKSRNPHSEVAVKDLQSGEVTVVTRGWDR